MILKHKKYKIDKWHETQKQKKTRFTNGMILKNKKKLTRHITSLVNKSNAHK